MWILPFGQHQDDRAYENVTEANDPVILDISCDSQMPTIEAVSSFASSYSGLSDSSGSSVETQEIENSHEHDGDDPCLVQPVAIVPEACSYKNTSRSSNLHVLTTPKTAIDILSTPSAWCVFQNRVSCQSPESISSAYLSRDELQVLLTPTCFDEYEQLVDDEQQEIEREREDRKKWIQQELDALVQATLEVNNDSSSSFEWEPEAIEALGIAANRVAYLKKYYHVPTCQYIYSPSVAYTILDGSLLEEAAEHYFGKYSERQEFLIAYAAALGSTILSRKDSWNLTSLPPSNSDVQDVDLGEDDDFEAEHNTAERVWAVSPQQQHIVQGKKVFSFNRTEKPSISKPWSPAKSTLWALIIVTCLGFGAHFLLLRNLQQQVSDSNALFDPSSNNHVSLEPVALPDVPKKKVTFTSPESQNKEDRSRAVVTVAAPGETVALSLPSANESWGWGLPSSLKHDEEDASVNKVLPPAEWIQPEVARGRVRVANKHRPRPVVANLLY